jgi:hypothetical protein
MSTIATKLQIGTAGCAVAVVASLMSVAPAQAAPAVAAPVAPVVLGPADVPLDWWGPHDPSGWFSGPISHSCYGAGLKIKMGPYGESTITPAKHCT